MECDSCGKKFEGPNAPVLLRGHVRVVHEQQRNHICYKSFWHKNRYEQTC